MLQRITSRQSEYRRQLWVDDWEKVEQLRDNITRYPQGLIDKQKAQRKVKFAAVMGSEHGENTDSTETARTDTARTDTARTDTNRTDTNRTDADGIKRPETQTKKTLNVSFHYPRLTALI
ncbi:uncharacterized protein si:ch211-284k5.2 [Etheostoma cragini]|uniref:uncharacterized protein si:ch211-284k5.2 n=1 Tax=Etheostoma cragini TaxID=417921 RepID=UPI00155DDFF9|nr:uncharacterized protein si:ch211-284k5.2 [Etheostoma cragini]